MSLCSCFSPSTYITSCSSSPFTLYKIPCLMHSRVSSQWNLIEWFSPMCINKSRNNSTELSVFILCPQRSPTTELRVKPNMATKLSLLELIVKSNWSENKWEMQTQRRSAGKKKEDRLCLHNQGLITSSQPSSSWKSSGIGASNGRGRDHSWKPN